jgi:formylmethanofuran dehydrogenase subunit B
VPVRPEDEVAVLTLAAEAVSSRRDVRPAIAASDETRAIREAVDALVTAFGRARYVVLAADGEADSQPRDAGRTSALIALAQTLNGSTRCALSVLRQGGNRSGADAVMTSQTGYPMAVDFARGYPRYRPYDGTAGARLARGDVDAMLVLGSTAPLAPELLTAMARVPCVVFGPRASEGALAGSRVIIDTGAAGVHESGTALRMDDVPLPLRRSLDGPASAEALVGALHARVGRR